MNKRVQSEGKISTDLHSVLAKDCNGISAKSSVPCESLGLAGVELIGEQGTQEVSVLLGNKVLVLLSRQAHADADVTAISLLPHTAAVHLRLLKGVPLVNSRSGNVLKKWY